MTIKSTLCFISISISSFILHYFMGFKVIAKDVSTLIYYIHIILFSWSCIHLFVMSKINNKKIIPVFFTLLILKMIISGLIVYLLNRYLDIDTKVIIANFFIAYFFYLFLQVFFSIKFLNKPNFAEN